MSPALSENRNIEQLVTFRLGGEEYGIEIGNVQEIIKLPGITMVPRAPHYLEGVVNLRGQILPIIDTRKRLNMEEIHHGPSNRVVVTSYDDTPVGLVVDSVSEVLRINSGEVELPPPSLYQSGSGSLKGICKHKSGQRLISILNLDTITRIDDVSDDMDSSFDYPAGIDGVDDSESAGLNHDVQMVSFQLGAEEYAVDINKVEEIIKIPRITRVPEAPGFISGIISIRGKVMPVINLCSYFCMTESPIDKRSRILILRRDVNGERVLSGVLVDMVNEVVSIPRDRIEDPPETVALDGRLQGIGKLEGGNRLVLILDSDSITCSSDISGIDEKSADAVGANRHPAKERGSLEIRQMVSLRLGNEEFGVDIRNVREIIRLTDITAVPGSPDYVRGVVNLRGDVLPVIDLRSRFGLDWKEPSGSDRIVVVTCQNRVSGLIVDSVSEVIQLTADSIESAPEIISEIDASFIEGIGKMNGGQRFVIILNVAGILNLQQESPQDVIDDDSAIDVVHKNSDAPGAEDDLWEVGLEEKVADDLLPVVDSDSRDDSLSGSDEGKTDFSTIELSEEEQLRALQEQLLAQMGSDDDDEIDEIDKIGEIDDSSGGDNIQQSPEDLNTVEDLSGTNLGGVSCLDDELTCLEPDSADEGKAS